MITFKEKLKIRFLLYRLWFYKNIGVFTQFFLLVLLLLTLTGGMPHWVPLLGDASEPFKELSEDLIFANFRMSNILNIVETAYPFVITALFAFMAFKNGLKSLNILDFKDKVKKKIVESGYTISIKDAVSGEMKDVISNFDELLSDSKDKNINLGGVVSKSTIKGMVKAFGELFEITTLNICSSNNLEDIKSLKDVRKKSKNKKEIEPEPIPEKSKTRESVSRNRNRNIQRGDR